MKKGNIPLVSVIITTRNEESVIEKLLKSIQTQTYSSLEIILVDNHSTDRTCEIARTYVDKLLIQGPERSAQRNLGVRESSGNYVLILDADMELSSNVVKEAVSRVTKDPSIKAIIIPEKSFGQNFWARCKTLERNCYIDNLTAVAGARFYERQLFLKAGGFDENITGPEDWDLSQRVGQIAQIGFIQSLIYHNEGQISLLNQMRKKYYYVVDPQNWTVFLRFLVGSLLLMSQLPGGFELNGRQIPKR